MKENTSLKGELKQQICSNKPKNKKETFLPIYDLTPFTLQDFPDHTACIIWISGCNMRCGYCHNPEIVLAGKGKGNITEKEVLAFLEDRKDKLDGVVLSGGEATLYKGIVAFARKIKKLGFAIKLDTNGTQPKIVKEMLDEGLLNFIGLDYKSPLSKFRNLTHSKKWSDFEETLKFLIKENSVDFEIRTTVHTDLLSEEDVQEIMNHLEEIGYKGKYYIQNFTPPEKNDLQALTEQDYLLQKQYLKFPDSFITEFRNFPET